MPFLTKQHLDNVSLYALNQMKDSRNTFFVPYTAKDFEGPAERNKQLRVAINAVISYYGYGSLMVLGGVAAAAIFAGKGYIENSESSEESYQYSMAIINATGTMFLHMNLDLLNFVSRALATAVTAASSLTNSAKPLVDGFFNLVDRDIEVIQEQSLQM